MLPPGPKTKAASLKVWRTGERHRRTHYGGLHGLPVKVADVRALLKSLGVRPSKGLGQSFLLDEARARRQVEAATLRTGEGILEIGPGLGILTAALVATGHPVTAIERDRRLAEELRRAYPTLDVIQGDALEVGWPPFDWCISNLPFSISSPLLFKLLDTPLKGAVLMVQREFARRLVAPVSGADYSRLTVKTLHRGRTELLWTVPPSAFWPPPKVSAAVVRFVPRQPPYAPVDEGLFSALVDVLFQHRRKAIATILHMRAADLGLAEGWEARVPMEVLRSRPQDLSPEELVGLSDNLVPPQH